MAGVLPIARPEAARWPTSLCHHGLAEKTSHPKHRDAPGRTSQSQSARSAQIVLSLQKRWRTLRSPISKTASAHFCAYVYVPLEISSVVLEEQPPPAAKQGQSSTRSKEDGGKKTGRHLDKICRCLFVSHWRKKASKRGAAFFCHQLSRWLE